jgi:hypothetical protein
MLKCKSCGLENKEKSKFCKSCGKDLQEEIVEIQNEKIEKEMGRKGYFKGKMCPFVVASIGGTTGYISGATFEKYEWQHYQCMEEFCRLWDDKAKECSFKIMVELLKKK